MSVGSDATNSMAKNIKAIEKKFGSDQIALYNQDTMKVSFNQDDLGKLRGYFKTAAKEKSKAGELWKAYIDSAKELK